MFKRVEKKIENLYRKGYNRWGIINHDPILVFGNQKSGTSVIAHLLALYAGKSSTIDIPEIWPPLGKDIILGTKFFKEAVNQCKFAFSKELVKEPMLTFFADQVIDFFPRGKYIFIVRDPRDNIRSILNRRNIPGNLLKLNSFENNGITLVGDKDVWWKNELGFNYISQLSERWVDAATQFFKNKDKFILVKYEDFIKDKVAFIQSLAQQLNLQQLNQIDSKVDIEYQPKGNKTISWNDFYGEENLKRIETICWDKMKELNY